MQSTPTHAHAVARWSHQVITPLVKDGAHTPGRATPINDHTTYTQFTRSPLFIFYTTGGQACTRGCVHF